jgi:hypothetical protein
MTLAELNEMLELLEQLIEMGKPHRYLQLKMLTADVKKYYKDKHRELGSVYRHAWDQAVLNRLDAMALPTALKREFAGLRHAWRARMQGVNLRIHFGQMKVGPAFAQSPIEAQNQIADFPAHIIGRPLNVVAGEITQGDILADQIPLQIFHHDGLWIAANNRCFTTYCLAGVRPLRIIPRLPEQHEINRLAEVEGIEPVGNFVYQHGGIAHLNTNPRTLPSLQIPVTLGPNSYMVTHVATAPTAWQ